MTIAPLLKRLDAAGIESWPLPRKVRHEGEFDSDAIRSALVADFANYPKRDEILRQYTARAERSLVAQYGDRLGPGERAWQAAWEIRITYGMPVPTMARRPGSDHR